MTTKLNKKGNLPPLPTIQSFPITTVKLDYSAKGNLQFVKEPMQQLYEITVSSLFGKDTYYQSSDELVKRLRTHVNTIVDAGQMDFIANVAIYARSVMLIRTIPVVLVVEFAKAIADRRESGIQYTNMRKLVCDVIQRADQINDFLAYTLEVFGNKKAIPMAVRRGLSDACNKFNEYHFGKYNKSTSVKFRDVLRIVHPVPKNDEQGTIFSKIMKDTLDTPYTWETQLSVNGQTTGDNKKSKKQLWTELVTSGKMGYMALLRNLRNICEAEIEPSVMREHVCAVIADPVRVAESKQFPFAFVQAYSAVKQIAPQPVLAALSTALDHSCINIPKIGNDIVILVDSSGSMTGNGYGNTFSPAEMAATLAAGLIKANSLSAYKIKVILFDTKAREHPVNATDNVMTIQRDMRAAMSGGATHLSAAFELMKKLKLNPDTVIVISDMQVDCMGNYVDQFPIYTTPNRICVAVNVNASPTTPLAELNGWYQIAGMSANMFKFIPSMREKTTVVDYLNVPYIGAENFNTKEQKQDDGADLYFDLTS